MRAIDHEDTKQHRHSILAWRADGGNESEDPNRPCRFKTLRLWQLVSLAGKIKRGISQRVFDEIV